MTILPTLLQLASEAHEEAAPMVAPPWVFALVAAIVFIGAALVTNSYRDVANRHADKVPADGGHGSDAGHH